jgi:hypothetical protein
MEAKKPQFSSAFYEDAGDLLAGFRKINGGARIAKKGADAFAKDPDVLQSQRQEKLIEQIRNADISGLSGW